MNSQNNSCEMVQESLAWGRNISRADKEHILNCQKCSEVAFQMEQLDSLIKDEHVELPMDFADNVMKIIMSSEKNHELQSLQDIILELFNNTFFRWGVGSVGFLIAFSAH